ncbi:MAG: glycosyl hydrolase family 28 protein [Anaerolineales bacterium]|nr:glycosyl hydrolase family 28 protein [Anaerolineales bacterium]
MTLSTCTYSPSCPASTAYRLLAEGTEQFVYHTAVADFVTFGSDGAVHVEVTLPAGAGVAAVHPLRRGIATERTGDTLRFTLPGAGNYVLQPEGVNPLFLYVNPLDLNLPAAGAHVRRIPAGTVADAGKITLKSGETLCIEPGAVLRGALRISNAENVTICGGGILDGGWSEAHHKPGPRDRLLVVEGCRNVTIRDIVLIQPESWMLVIGACRDVLIQNVREIGRIVGSDGIDVVGSRDVLIENCCIRNNDDGICIKSTRGDSPLGVDWRGDVENVTARGCVLWNAEAGNALEIGHELQAESVRHIRFEDIDILCVHGQGAPFSIHNGDRAVVENVVFENIRVEHHYDKLIDFRIMRSRFNHDEQRGQVRNVTLRNIEVDESIFNPGYTISVIGGWDADHTIEGVHFENFRLGGRPVLKPEDLPLYTAHSKDITFH